MLAALFCILVGFYTSYILTKLLFGKWREKRWIAIAHLGMCVSLVILTSYLMSISAMITSSVGTPILNWYVAAAILGALFHWGSAFFGWEYKEWRSIQDASRVITEQPQLKPHWQQSVRDASIVTICSQMLLNWQDPARNQSLLCCNQHLADHVKQTLEIAGHRTATGSQEAFQPIAEVTYDLINADPANDTFVAKIKNIQFDYSNSQLKRPDADFLELFDLQLTMHWQQNAWQLSDMTSMIDSGSLDEEAYSSVERFANLHNLSYMKRGYGRCADTSDTLADYILCNESPWPEAHTTGRLGELPIQICVAPYSVGWDISGRGSAGVLVQCIYGRIVLARAMPAFLIWRPGKIDTPFLKPSGYQKADINNLELQNNFHAYLSNSDGNAASKMNDLLHSPISNRLLAEPGRVYLEIEGSLASIYIERETIDSQAYEDILAIMGYIASWSSK